MDIDCGKPVYVFVLDFSDTGKPTTEDDLPVDLLSQCRHLGDVTASEEKPAIAVRGSTAPLGSWNVDGVRAASLAADRYAVLINDYLPADTQYKWLNLTGVSITGDVDPGTGYHYEPNPFVDRTVAGDEVLPGDIVFVFNTWGTYSSTVHKDFLDKWLPDTATGTESPEKTTEVPVTDDGATKPDTTAIHKETEPEVSSDLPAASVIPIKSSVDQSVDAKIDIVTEHYETQKTGPGDEEDEETETETDTSEEEISVSNQYDVAATVDTMGNETEAPDITEGDEVKDEKSGTTGDAPEEKASEEQEVMIDLEEEVLKEEAVTSVSEASTGITIKDEENQMQGNDQSSTQAPVDEQEDDQNQEGADDAQISHETSLAQEERGEPENDESFMASEEIEMTITTISSQIVQGGKITGKNVNQDMENNNTVLSQGKTTETDDVCNANEAMVEKLNVSNLESSVMSSDMEKVSEATFKRMSRISDSDAPETDQVNEVLICSEQSKITVTKGQRIPSSSSC